METRVYWCVRRQVTGQAPEFVEPSPIGPEYWNTDWRGRRQFSSREDAEIFRWNRVSKNSDVTYAVVKVTVVRKPKAVAA
jgi:hypothetical protein